MRESHYTDDEPELERVQAQFAWVSTAAAILLSLYIIYMENEEAITSFLRG